jgi:hypothetical protein
MVSGERKYQAVVFVSSVASKEQGTMTMRYLVRYYLWEIRRRPLIWIVLVIATLSTILLGTVNWGFWDETGSPTLLGTDAGSLAANNTGSVDWPPSTDKREELFDGDTSASDVISRRPDLPLSCDTIPFTHHPEKYCAWRTNIKDCLEMLRQPMRESSSWVFLGGPETVGLAYYMSLKWPSSMPSSNSKFNVTSRRNPCQNLLYYGFPPPNHGWIPPDPSKGEGPVLFGLENPYCMDCKKCWNVLLEDASPFRSSLLSPPPFAAAAGADVATKANNRERRRGIEYLVVEYARDVSIQTLVTNTTQETAAYYLGMQRPDVCVVSVGLWDAAIGPPIPQSVFVNNVDRYFGLLQRVCRNVVWISIPAVVEDKSIPQKNCQLQEWNAAVLKLLNRRGYNNFYVIDIWDKSLETDHVGYVVLHKKWYATLARLFVAVSLPA